jgi:hypothetical protein
MPPAHQIFTNKSSHTKVVFQLTTPNKQQQQKNNHYQYNHVKSTSIQKENFFEKSFWQQKA